MKVLLVVPWDGRRGGVQSVVENLARYLQGLTHTVLFFHPGPAVVLKIRTTELGFWGIQLRLCFPLKKPRPLVSTVAFPFLFPVVLVQLIWFLRRHRIQIMNVHYPTDNFFYFAICKRLLKIRLVTSVHGGDAFVNGRPKAKYSKAFKFLLDSSDLIILPSDTYRKSLVQVLPKIREKTIFIHNGINPDQFRLPQTGENIGKRRYILCIGALVHYKGIDVLLKASKTLLMSDESLDLVFVGDGPQRPEFERLASVLGIDKQTQFLGSREAAKVAMLLRGCEVMVLPSREESFGIVILEAFAARKPVVAAAVGGIPEIIEHEQNGILVEPDNPAALSEGLRRVLTNSELRKNLGENGYSRLMECFCFDRTGAAYERAFASLLDRQTPSSH
jgi:glycosyltransferase involved in cell wall biosynthesis